MAAQTDSGSTIIFFLEIVLEYTEIGRAPLINFQKLVLNKLLYRLKLFRKFKFNIWMTISTNLVYNEFSKKNLSWLIWNILRNGYNMMKRSWCHYSLHNFRNYFFPLGEVKVSFSNLLTRTNNYRNFFSDFFMKKSHLELSISRQKYADNFSFYVLKVQRIWHKIITFCASNILDPLPRLNMHLIINNALLWDQKDLNWRDLEIIKGVGLILRPIIVEYDFDYFSCNVYIRKKDQGLRMERTLKKVREEIFT